MAAPDLRNLLGRWHQWRRGYTHERGYARASLLNDEHDDELEVLTMSLIDAEVLRLSQDHQIALQHLARAECLGVEVILNPRLGDAVTRSALVEAALRELRRRLLMLGLL